MDTLIGRAISPGAALACACVALPNGVECQGDQGAAREAPRGSQIDRDVVMVVRHGCVPHVGTTAGVRVVGMVVSDPAVVTFIGAGPVVECSDDDLDLIPPGKLVLVDGGSGTVTVDPDGMAIAAFQAEAERISPRKRVFVDSCHLPVSTTDGLNVRVVCAAATIAAVLEGVGSGCDEVLIEGSDEASPNPIGLRALILELRGKPVTIRAGAVRLAHDLDRLPDVTVAHDVSSAPSGVVPDSRPTALVLPGGREYVDALDAPSITRVIASPWRHEHTDWLSMLVADAASRMLPVAVDLRGTPLNSGLVAAVGCRAGAVVVRPSQIGEAKEALRHMDAAACFEALAAQP